MATATPPDALASPADVAAARIRAEAGAMLDDALRGGHLEVMGAAARRSLLERLILAGRAELRGITQQLIDKVYGLGRWFAGMATNISARLHAATWGLLGGRVLQPADQANLDGRVKGQVAYLRGFRAAIKSGDQLLDGTALARAEMYADAAWATAMEVERGKMMRAGRSEVKRILGTADHCAGCLGEAGKGFRPIDAPLPYGIAPIGSVDCLSRCHCTLVYR
jgi:hypothetical protein